MLDEVYDNTAKLNKQHSSNTVSTFKKFYYSKPKIIFYENFFRQALFNPYNNGDVTGCFFSANYKRSIEL
jgi:hypothetical protein